MNDKNKIIGKNIRDLRQNKQFTQKELADKLGVCTSTIGNYERGIRKVPEPILSKISDLFNVDGNYITDTDSLEKHSNIKIDGISEKREINWSIYYIIKLTEDIKNSIRDNLNEICQGPDPIDDSYINTAREFVNRCKTSDKNRVMGMIGEFLVHLILLKYHNFLPASIMFNLEEKSFKKGYDILLYKSIDKSLWITEVKSGIVPNKKTANNKLGALIDRAKNDLNGRLNNNEEKSELWMNAYNHAQKAVEESNNERAMILKLIKKDYKKTQQDTVNSIDDNVILSSVLFHPLIERATETVVKDKQQKYKTDKLFKNVIIIAIQEDTCDDILNFLKDEVKNG